MDHSTTEREIIALERAALERWCRGDPSGFLEISAPDVSYFDPFLPHRLDGLAALTAYYEGLRGTVSVAGHEMVAPAVRRLGDAVTLAFRFESTLADGRQLHWNCTEVYRRDPDGWRIVHTHWSFAAAPAAAV